MLLLPVCYYGSPTPNDIEWNSFVILFKSLYEEGFARPEGGVRTILDLLRHRYAELGGELRMRCGVERVLHSDGIASGVHLEDGTEIAADRVISSAGYVETMRLCGDDVAASAVRPEDIGDLSFVESLSVLDTKPADLGHDATITFFNTEDRLVYAKPETPVDYRSGVICCPDNYECNEPAREGMLRLTLLANYDAWTTFSDERYREEKETLWNAGHAAIADFAPDIRPHTVFKDIFTPRTIEKFTGHLNGAVYGSPRKRTSAETDVRGLYICGTDQGYLGIVGAMLSGVSVANRHALIPA
jgi:phytoene dehydrogenase-like protein